MGEQENQQLADPDGSRDLVRHKTTITRFSSGPLPPPSDLEHYERVLPGAAERIFRMAEEQSQHRRRLEAKVIESDTANSRLGLYFGLIIGVVAIGASVLIVWLGYPKSGSAFGLLYIGSLIGVFVYGSRQRHRERTARRRSERAENPE